MKAVAWFLTAMVALGSAGANAATLTISPVSVVLDPGRTSAVLEVTNLEPAPVTLQARIYNWSQSDNEDLLAPTSDIIMSPPIATIPPGGSQTLRLLLRPGAKAITDRERHYRVLLDEIPAVGAGSGRVSFAMRSSIPVIVKSPSPSSSRLGWHAARDGGGAVVITAINSAIAYDQIFALAAILDDGTVHNGTLRGTNAYVLPQARRQWVVPGKHGSGSVRLRITARDGKTEQILPIAP